jgi:hypothetical protein
LHAQQIALVAQQYAIDIPYDYERFIARGRELVVETSLRLVELGLILIHIREREPHGMFLPALERIGVAPRFAQRAMQAAIKMRDRPRISGLGVTKTLELVAEDDETLDALEKGGTVAGLTLDKIGTMSTRELRAALRAERAERAEEKSADEEIIRKKDERINKLSRRLTKNSAREQADELVADYNRFALDVAANLKAAAGTIEAIRKLYDDIGEHPDEEISQALDAGAELIAPWVEKFEDTLGR